MKKKRFSKIKEKYAEARVLSRELVRAINSGNICSYCGCIAQDNEHIVPRAWFGHDYSDHFHRRHGNIVRSCSSCNKLAGKNYFESFWYKKQYIKDMIYIRYENYLSVPLWEKDELGELDRGWLQDYIKCCAKIRDVLHFRIENLNKPEVILKD